MKKYVHTIMQTYWPILVLFVVEIALFTTNYHPGTYLMGWDNVMPEFNFKQALITNIFGAWQEHRGVGLPDGMGHAANLVHTITIWIMSLVLPQNLLRYAFHFLMHLLGMVGMYLLVSRLPAGKAGITYHASRMQSLLAALFYGLNLITIQMFYTPLEAFSVHFVALPWLAYALIGYLRKPHQNTLLLFSIVSLLTTPQFFIPTLILPTVLLLTTVSLPFIKQWRRICIAACTFIAVNAFWILPYLYHLPQNASIIQNAKINQMSSSEIYARNQVFGDLPNVLTMRGFMLDFEDVNTEGLPIYVMNTWRSFTALPGIGIASLFLASVSFMGFGVSIFNSRKPKPMVSYALLYGVSFTFLATNTPILKDIMGYLRDHLPLFAEAYRFPFTKFSLLFGFASTLMIAEFFRFAGDSASRRIAKLKLTYAHTIGVIITMIAIFGVSMPAFQGQFFYDALKVALPKDYAQLFTFMSGQDPTGRTAYLPSPSYWSWKHYNYGYVGSGFLWYGLSQPLMDRAFDPWSNINENYYWELSRALYAKDASGVADVFQKYDIRYIILDEHLWAPGHDRSLFISDTKSLLSSIPDIHTIKHTNTVTIYELTAHSRSFIRTTGLLPAVSPSYIWTDDDYAYRMIGDYKIYNENKGNGQDSPIIFPFRSLFTKRSTAEREFTIDEVGNEIRIKPNTLQVPESLFVIDKTSPIFSTINSQALNEQAIKACGVLKKGTVKTAVHDGVLQIISSAQRNCLSFSIDALPHKDAYLVSVESRHISGRPLMVSLINNTAKHVEIETVLEPRTTNAWQTDYFVLPPLAADGLGYTIYITNDAIDDTETINEIQNISVYPLTYEMLTRTSQKTYVPQADTQPRVMAVNHPNPSYYRVEMENTSRVTLILSQAYNSNWKAYDITGKPWIARLTPWFYVPEITPHTKINNWENGWTLSENQHTIVILFMPQILQYVGYILLTVPILLILKIKT